MTNILIVDDEQEIGRFLTRLFQAKKINVTYADSGKAFDALTQLDRFDAAFLDVRLPDRNGLELLKKLKKEAPFCKTVVMTGYSTVKMAIEAIQLGAEDFLEKPFEDIMAIEALVDQLTTKDQLDAYKEEAQRSGVFLGTSSAVHELYRLAFKLADKNITILIEGETGTGKEVLARFLHQAGNRSKGPFIGLNCGAISESLLESELFGHAKGSFTGAAENRAGFFEVATDGTLFLDEIAEASHATQVKLLRVLETGEYFKIGDPAPRQTGARIIAASHASLEKAVSEGTFRSDLLYRLDVVKLVIPPLRERQQDITHFIDLYSRKNGMSLPFSPDAMNVLKTYHWPGNIRELVNTLQRLFVLYADEPVITPHMLPEKMNRTAAPLKKASPQTRTFESDWRLFSSYILDSYANDEAINLDDLVQTMKRMEKRTAEAFIHKTLKETAGNREQAAQKLGISKRKIRYYLNET